PTGGRLPPVELEWAKSNAAAAGPAMIMAPVVRFPVRPIMAMVIPIVIPAVLPMVPVVIRPVGAVVPTPVGFPVFVGLGRPDIGEHQTSGQQTSNHTWLEKPEHRSPPMGAGSLRTGEQAGAARW